MTVAVAAKFMWPYAADDYGPAIVVAADRMLTSGTTEQTEHTLPVRKGRWLKRRSYLVAGGAIQVHNALLVDMMRYVESHDELSAWEYATEYARLFREYRASYAERLYLAPLGLTIQKFIESMPQFPESKTLEILHNIESCELAFEALIVGYDDQNWTCLLEINNAGQVINHDDIGYAAIGLGASHANAHMMATRYSPSCGYYEALWAAFSAKTRGESAPGVGPETDMVAINRDGTWLIDYRLMWHMLQLADDRRDKIHEFDRAAAQNIHQFLKELREKNAQQKAASQKHATGPALPPGGSETKAGSDDQGSAETSADEAIEPVARADETASKVAREEEA